MGFYGNITSVNKSTFQFDKIYANRFEMDANCETDGVFIGRFVLVDYDKGSSLSHGINEEEAQKTKITPAYMITDETGAISFHTGNSYTTPQFLLAGTENCDVNNSTIEKDALILILGRRKISMVIHDYTIYDPSQQQNEAMQEIIAHEGDYESMIPQLWKCTGAGRIVRFTRTKTDENGNPVLDENNQPEVEIFTVTTAGFEKLAIDYGTEDDTGVANDYNANYTTDMANYTNSGRGWDSTVWQKTWKDGKAKYVMIAELNSVVPTFDISVDAPTEVPLVPHWSEDSSNVYYKLHVQPQWGVRVKGQLGDFYTTDTKNYPSDVNGTFVVDSKINNETLQKIGIRVITDSAGNPILEDGKYKIETYTIELNDKQEIADDEFNAFPLAIYWNKAGFDPYQGSDAIKDMIIKKSLPENSNYEAAAARFVGPLEENEGQDLNKWASKWTLKDSIAFKPSGLSRNTYNKHGGIGTLFNDQILPDTYELSIMLPSLGQAMSDVWDIVYGKSSVTDINGRTLWHKETGRFATKDLNQQMRNVNYQWDTYNGERLVSDLAPQDDRTKSTNGYLKYNKGLMTSLIANINSVHDLMGMIIRDYENNLSNVANWDPTKIYFVNGAYYKKHKTYTYTNVNAGENAEKDSYVPINNMIDLANEQGIYRVDLGEFPTFDDPELSQLSDKPYINYRLASGKEEYIEGAKYVRLTPGAEAHLNAEGYEPNQYFIKKRTQPTIVYELDRGDTPSVEAGGNYFKIIPTQCTGFEFYVPYRYWMLNTSTKEIVFCTAATLAGVLGKDENQHDIIDSAVVTNVKFYREANITPNENESITETRYVRKRVEPPVIIKEITAVPEDTSRYKYEVNSTDNKKYLSILATDGVTVIETIPEDDITSLNAETLLPENYYAPKYEVVNSNSYSTLTVWARELINNRLPQDSPDLIEWKYDNEGNKIPEYQYYYVAADDTFSLEGKQEVRLKEFISTDNLKYFIENSAQINGEKKFIRFTEETISNLRGTTYGLARNTLNQDTNTIQYYTLELETQQAFYNLSGNFYYQNADNDWLRETLPKTAVNGAPQWSASKTYNKEDEVKYDNASQYDIIYRSLENNNVGIEPGTDLLKWEEVRRIPNYFGAPTETLVTERIFIPNYFYKLVDNKYILADTFENNTTYYELNGKYVSADTNKIYDIGAKWNQEVPIPSGVTLATRNVAWEAEKLEGFAQNLNTIHGLILKINNKLLTDDKLTRDRNTVQGAINVLNDIIDKFHTLVPTEIIMVDDYGRIHSGDTDTIQSGTFENIGTTATGDIAAAQNAWIKITNSIGADHKPHIKLEHQLLHTENPTTTTADKNTANGTGLNVGIGDTLQLYTPIVDSMGHVIGKNTETVTLPYGFKTVSIGAESSVATNLTHAAADLVAENTQDTLTINPGNKWMKLAAIANDDSFSIGHLVQTIDTTSAANSDINDNGDTITIQDISNDEAGHITANKLHTYTLPYGFKTITGNGGSLVADNTQDTAAFSGDTWIQTTASSEGVLFTHIGPANVSERTVVNVKPNFGETFDIEDWRFDEKGHKAGLQIHTVEMPDLSLTNGTHDATAAAVVTSLTLANNANENADGKVFTQTTADVGTLPLTGYVSQETNPLIFPANSINTAFATIESSLFGLLTGLAGAIGTNADDKDVNSIFGAKAYADDVGAAANTYTDNAINNLEATYDTGELDPENPEQNIIDSASLNELLVRIRTLEAKVYALENPESNGGGGE